MVVRVIVNVDTKEVDKLFDYAVRDIDTSIVKIGSRVMVEFRTRKVLGYVFEIVEESEFKGKLKPIEKVVDLEPILSEEMINIVKYIKENYYVTYIKAINTILPFIDKLNFKQEIVVINKDKISEDLLDIIKKQKNLDIKRKDTYLKLKEEEKKGNIKFNYKFILKNLKVDYYVKLNKDNTDIKFKSEKARILLDYLISIDRPILKAELTKLGYSLATIKYLLDKNIITYTEKKRYTEPKIVDYKPSILIPNEEQEIAINSVELGKFNNYLLYGITGSGKTLVYIELIKKVLKENKEVILLVPEINLTPQIASIFKYYFGSNIAIIHSNLSAQERITEYTKIKNREVKIVLGPRSAIFSPLTNLGLIIVDEEHVESYAQDNVPCYDGREIALFRAKYYNIPIIFGSATPRVSSFYNAINNKAKLLTLKNRATKVKLPKLEIVDMRLELKNKNVSTISNLLKEEITNTLAKGEQAILFYNRRGFATSVMCRDCGHVITCPNCEVPLTYHQDKDNLVCHLCGHVEKNQNACPRCKSKRIRYVGLGTEKIVSDVEELFPNASTLRVDSDSVGRNHAEFYEDMRDSKSDIIIGTQMIAKGLDFPNVTLVGIINADIGFFHPSYDANEENYSLLEQVIGRSGRHKEGKVVIQTYNPDHFVIESLIKNDYKYFYDVEIKKRYNLSNPPFKNIIKICLIAESQSLIYTESLSLATKLKDIADLIVLGPIEAVRFRVNNTFTYEIYLKYDKIDLDYLNKCLDKVKVFVKISHI